MPSLKKILLLKNNKHTKMEKMLISSRFINQPGTLRETSIPICNFSRLKLHLSSEFIPEHGRWNLKKH